MTKLKHRLSQEILDTLKCRKCNNVLSVPPILISSDGYQCGRCKDEDDSKIRATAYENLAKTYLFPCKYKSDGCPKYLEFEKVSVHENNCKFIPKKCPVCNSIFKESDNNNMLEHIETVHQDLLINPNEFQLCGSSRKLFIEKERIYILDVLAIEHDLTKFVLWYVGNAPEDTYYQLKIEHDINGTRTTIQFDKKKLAWYRGTKTYDFDAIYYDRNLDSANYTFKIQIMNNIDIKKCTTNFKEELLCPVCMQYMIPPIYICEGGHSVCSDCKSELTKCPSCKNIYNGCRNFSLEKVVESIDYRCSNEHLGCSYIGNIQNVDEHEDTCPYKSNDCPFKKELKCSWGGDMKKIFEHVKERHCSQKWENPNVEVLSLSRVSDKRFQFVSTEGKISGLLKFDGNYFKVALEKKRDDYVYWSIKQLEGDNESTAQYIFTLEFFDQKFVGRKLTLTDFCGNLQVLKQIPFGVLKPFVNDDKLLFEINLSISECYQKTPIL